MGGNTHRRDLRQWIQCVAWQPAPTARCSVRVGESVTVALNRGRGAGSQTADRQRDFLNEGRSGGECHPEHHHAIGHSTHRWTGIVELGRPRDGDPQGGQPRGWRDPSHQQQRNLGGTLPTSPVHKTIHDRCSGF